MVSVVLVTTLHMTVADTNSTDIFFTIVGYECNQTGSELSTRPVATRSQCRLMCALNAECVTVQTALNEEQLLCTQHLTFEGAQGRCTTASCCYNKGEPPAGVIGYGTVLAGQDECPWLSDTPRNGTLPIQLILGIAGGCAFLILSCAYSIARGYSRSSGPPSRAQLDAEERQDQVDSLPTTICRQRGVAALLDTAADELPAGLPRAAANIEAAGGSTASGEVHIGLRPKTWMSLGRYRHQARRPADSLSLGAPKLGLASAGGCVAADGEDECSLCMLLYEPGDTIRHLPCRHVYHVECVDRWLTGGQDRTCPLCKADPFAPSAANSTDNAAACRSAVETRREEADLEAGGGDTDGSAVDGDGRGAGGIPGTVGGGASCGTGVAGGGAGSNAGSAAIRDTGGIADGGVGGCTGCSAGFDAVGGANSSTGGARRTSSDSSPMPGAVPLAETAVVVQMTDMRGTAVLDSHGT
jgi:hypothetical protein